MGFSISIENHMKLDKLKSALTNDSTWLFAAQQWHRLYHQYVPFKTGTLAQSVTYAPGEITHTAPYAHYQYEGKVYGVNYPIMQGGIPVGYYSKGKKSPTGGTLKQNGQAHWDEYAAVAQGDALCKTIADFLLKQMG